MVAYKYGNKKVFVYYDLNRDTIFTPLLRSPRAILAQFVAIVKKIPPYLDPQTTPTLESYRSAAPLRRERSTGL